MKAKWITPSITALDKTGHVDLEANARLYENLITNGMDGILILGSIGEFFAIPIEEKKELVAMAVKKVAGRAELIVGTNCPVQSDCIEFSNYALGQGADAVMVIGPYYFNMPDSAIEYYFDTIAKNVSGNMYLYNFPARTGYALKPKIIKKLVANNPNIIGIKDTVPNMESTRSIIQKVKGEYPEFKVYSGFDEFFGHNLLSGGDGCITGISNFVPKVASGYAEAARADDLAAMGEYQRKIDSLMSIYEIGEQFVPIIKKAVQLMGVEIEDRCTEPLQAATAEETEAIRQMLMSNGQI